MKAVVVTDFGAQPELVDLPTPEPGPGEILVRIHAAGVNPFDWKVTDGALKDSVQHTFPGISYRWGGRADSHQRRSSDQAAGLVARLGAHCDGQ